MAVPYINLAEIQAQILVPIIKALHKEFGEVRVNGVIKNVIDTEYRQIGRDWFDHTNGTPTERIKAAIDMFSEPKSGTSDPPIEVKELKRTNTEYDFNITRCDYAKLYKDLGVPELGALLVCGVDHPMTEGYNAGVKLDRAQTIMLGADYCPFRYKVYTKD